MSKTGDYIPVKVTSILSGIFVPVVMYLFARIDMRLDTRSLFFNIILSLSPIFIIILISLISGYKFTNFDSNEKYQFGRVFLLATGISFCISFVVLYSYLFFRVSTCERDSCGIGTDPLIPFFLCCPAIGIISAVTGLSITLFYKVGIWIKQYQYDGYRLNRYRH